MEEKAVFKKYPVLLVAVSIAGIAVIVLTAIAGWGKVKAFTYFGLFMNAYFYVNILIFALYGYHNEKSLTKKPIKNLLKSFCMLLLVVTITTVPIIKQVAVIYGLVIIIDLIMMKHIKDLAVGKALVFIILALLLVAAFFKLDVFGHMPHEITHRGVWLFDVFNQVIQWTAFGMSYVLRGTEFKRAGYLD